MIYDCRRCGDKGDGDRVVMCGGYETVLCLDCCNRWHLKAREVGTVLMTENALMRHYVRTGNVPNINMTGSIIGDVEKKLFDMSIAFVNEMKEKKDE